MAEDGQNPHGHQLRIQPKLGDKPQPGHNKELQRLDDWWLKYSQEQEQEIQNLTVKPPLMISMLYLISL